MALFCVVWNRSSRHWGGEYGGVDGGYAGDVAPVSPDPNKAIHSTGILGRGALADISARLSQVDAVAKFGAAETRLAEFGQASMCPEAGHVAVRFRTGR